MATISNEDYHLNKFFEVKGPELTQKSIKNYQYFFKEFKQFIGNGRPLTEVVEYDVVQYKSYLSNDKKLQPSSINTHLMALRSLYRFFDESPFVNSKNNPMTNIKDVRADEKKYVYLTNEEELRLLDAAHDARTRLTILAFLETGVRVSELNQIKKIDINFEEKKIKIYGKGAVERFVPISNDRGLISELKRYTEGFKDDARIFDVTAMTLQHDIRGIAKKAKIGKKVSPHTLRHTLATHYLKNGGNIIALQKILGHTSLRTTQMYITYEEDLVLKDYEKTMASRSGNLMSPSIIKINDEHE
jgi:site-specific recombinase XerD